MSVVSIKKKDILPENMPFLLLEAVLNGDHMLLDGILQSDLFEEKYLPLNILHLCLLSHNFIAFSKIVKISSLDVLNNDFHILDNIIKTPLDYIDMVDSFMTVLYMGKKRRQAQFVRSCLISCRNALVLNGGINSANKFQIFLARVRIFWRLRFMKSLKICMPVSSIIRSAEEEGFQFDTMHD